MHMKHILPILTLTTLAAAASAQAAAPAGLSYNRIEFSSQRLSGDTAYVLSAQAMLGASNFIVKATSTVGGDTANGTDSVSLGYVFKNFAFGTDATLAVGSNENYTIQLRKDIGNNLEVGALFNRTPDNDVWGLELAYNLSKQIQVAVGYADIGEGHITALSARYNF